jgi:hypothetical protein
MESQSICHSLIILELWLYLFTTWQDTLIDFGRDSFCARCRNRLIRFGERAFVALSVARHGFAMLLAQRTAPQLGECRFIPRQCRPVDEIVVRLTPALLGMLRQRRANDCGAVTRRGRTQSTWAIRKQVVERCNGALVCSDAGRSESHDFLSELSETVEHAVALRNDNRCVSVRFDCRYRWHNRDRQVGGCSIRVEPRVSAGLRQRIQRMLIETPAWLQILDLNVETSVSSQGGSDAQWKLCPDYIERVDLHRHAHSANVSAGNTTGLEVGTRTRRHVTYVHRHHDFMDCRRQHRTRRYGLDGPICLVNLSTCISKDLIQRYDKNPHVHT